MNARRAFCAALLIAISMAEPVSASYIWFSSAPSSVNSGEGYYMEAAASTEAGGDLTLWRNNAYQTSTGGYGTIVLGAWFADAGPQTLEYIAECWDWSYGGSDFAYAYVSVNSSSNTPPTAWVEVDGSSSGATITRPYGGSVNVTVRYKAGDSDGNLARIRPQVWHPDSGYFTNDGGAWTGQSGGYGEVVRTLTLDRNGNWYVWTDAEDTNNVFVNSGPWDSAFYVNVVEAPPPNSAPTVSVWAATTSLYTQQTAQIYVRGEDIDGNARYFNLDQVSPLNCFYGPGDSFTSSSAPNNGAWDLGFPTADYTRTVNMTFDRPGVYVWRGAVNDGSGWHYSSSNHVITVPNRDPSLSLQILDANQNVVALNGDGRARLLANTHFYIRVNGSDPDGRLLRLYSRVNNAGGAGVAYEQHDVSGGSASWTFGPYHTGTSVGIWNVWGHCEDQDNTGYQWQGGGWWGADSPDIEVAENQSPITNPLAASSTLVMVGQSVTLTSQSYDVDNNLTSHAIDYIPPGGNTWISGSSATGTRWDGLPGNSHSLSMTMALPLGGTWQFRARAADQFGLSSSYQYVNIIANRPPQTLSMSATPNTSASPGQEIALTGRATDPDENLEALHFYVKGPGQAGWEEVAIASVSGGDAQPSVTWRIPSNAATGLWSAQLRARDTGGAYDSNANVTSSFMVKYQQATVSSRDGWIAVAGSFSPGTQGYYIGGNGTGSWQFVIGGQTHWPAGGQSGTLLLTNNTVSESWSPPNAQPYGFWVRKLGDDNFYDSNMAGPYTLSSGSGSLQLQIHRP